MLSSRFAFILAAVSLPHSPPSPLAAGSSASALQCPGGGRQKVEATLDVVEDGSGAPGISLVVDAIENGDAMWEAELLRNSGELVATLSAEDAPRRVVPGRAAIHLALFPDDLAVGYYLVRARVVAVDAAGSESISVAEAFFEATSDGVTNIDSAEWFSRAGVVAVSDAEVADE